MTIARIARDLCSLCEPVEWFYGRQSFLTNPDGNGILFLLYFDFDQFDKTKKNRVDSGTNSLYGMQNGCF
jgi:hypothetical protein